MTGQITQTLEAILVLTIRGPVNHVEIETVLDTGFNEYLTLPRATIDQLQLPYVDTAECELADGRMVAMDSFLATVEWHGSPRQVLVLDADGDPLIGMAILKDSRVAMDVVVGGALSVDPIGSTPG